MPPDGNSKWSFVMCHARPISKTSEHWNALNFLVCKNIFTCLGKSINATHTQHLPNRILISLLSRMCHKCNNSSNNKWMVIFFSHPIFLRYISSLCLSHRRNYVTFTTVTTSMPKCFDQIVPYIHLYDRISKSFYYCKWVINILNEWKVMVSFFIK